MSSSSSSLSEVSYEKEENEVESKLSKQFIKGNLKMYYFQIQM